MAYDGERALELLRTGSGFPQACFREGQEEAIRHIVEGIGRLLVVQKTGWGKSFVYFIATKLLREAGTGPALLVSPLLSLMRNQIAAAERMGVRAGTINSANQDEWEVIEAAIIRDDVDILLISPERLSNERFGTKVLALVAGRIALLVIDEAHCISDWGHDFRPDYRLLERTVQALPPNLRLLATTATANDRVLDDLRLVLGPNLTVSRGDLNRPSLLLQTISLPTQAERLAWLAERVPELPGSGIIYALTIRDANQVAAWLISRGVNVAAYTSNTDPEERPKLEQALLENKVKALVATMALGMGFDKPDLSFVVHYQAPGSVVAYYQQVGRAGRALDAAYGVLLSGEEEIEITDYFIDNAFPTQDEVAQIIEVLEGNPSGLSVPELLGHVNVSNGRIDKAIELMSLESPAPIAKQGTKWQLTAADLSENFWHRAERLAELRREEQKQMQQYVSLNTGHMQFLIEALDGVADGIHSPEIPKLPASVTASVAQEAVAFLRRTILPIEPRRQWPTGGLPQYNVRGQIPVNLRAQPGKALCVYGDAGWGKLVIQGKNFDKRFADTLVEACAKLVEDWNPHPAPTWVTSIPSLRNPDVVPEFANRLANVLSLPYVESLSKTDSRPEQKTMANSTHQALNVDGSLEIAIQTMHPGPVLLVDDIVNSRWTFAVATWLLISHGSEEVWPLALASTGH